MKYGLEAENQKLYELLTDATNFDWQPTGDLMVYEWREGDQSLDVKATSYGQGVLDFIVFWNTKTKGSIQATSKDPLALEVATHYTQFAECEGEHIGSQDEFHAFLTAYRVLGGEVGFMSSAKKIIAIIGEESVYCEWDGKRYELYDHGLVRYAITEDGLKRAYAEIVEWVEVTHRNLAEQNA